MNRNTFMLKRFIFISLIPLVISIKNKTILNVTNNLNISYIKEEIGKYEKQYIDLYAKSSKNEESFCDKIDSNIKLFQNIQNKLINIETDIDKGILNSMEMKEFLNMRGDISFSIQNIEIIIKKLQRKKKFCVNNDNEFEIVKKNIKAKNQKNKEDLVKSINHILKINNDL